MFVHLDDVSMVAEKEFGDGVYEANLIREVDQEDGGGFAYVVWVEWVTIYRVLLKLSINSIIRQLGLFCNHQARGNVEALEAVLD